jgi:FeS assembly SUF system protein
MEGWLVADEASKSVAQVSLPVLPHSGKVEQLKSEPARTAAPAAGAEAAHVNRYPPLGDLASPNRELMEKVIEALRSVYDPEIPINIYDLGLIYHIEIDDENRVEVKMTLTAPGCPVAGSLPPSVEQRIEGIEEVKSAKVELVWEPQWGREMMSEVARLELGM